MIGRQFQELNVLAPTHLEQALSDAMRVLSGERISSAVYQFVARDGTKKWGEVSGAPLVRDGQIVGLISVARDITERVRAEEALRASEEQYRLLAETTRDLILLHDMQGRVVYVNQAGLDFAGFEASEAIGRSISDFVPPQHLPDLIRRQKQRLAGDEQTLLYQSEFANRDGQRIPVEVNSTPVVRDGQVSHILIVTRDITERVRAEQALKEYADRLEEMVEERTQELRDAQEQLVRQERLAVLGQLAGGVAHELRNPLGVITNAIYYLKLVQPEADETVREYLDLIESESRRAAQIGADLLDFARIKRVDREPAAVSELVTTVLDRQPPPENVTVTTDIPADLPPAFVDPRQIERVLTNLVTNAYQAMPAGGRLVVRAECEGDEETRRRGDKGRGRHGEGERGRRGEGERLTPSPGHPLPLSPHLRVSVSDTGSGISPENMDKLFEPLFTTKARGIGLGLAISKRLVEANGGIITVTSQEGKGSTFTVWLPVVSNQVSPR